LSALVFGVIEGHSPRTFVVAHNIVLIVVASQQRL